MYHNRSYNRDNIGSSNRFNDNTTHITNQQNNNENRSNRTRNSYMSVDKQTVIDDNFMDITTGEECEVNFLTLPLNVRYP